MNRLERRKQERENAKLIANNKQVRIDPKGKMTVVTDNPFIDDIKYEWLKSRLQGALTFKLDTKIASEIDLEESKRKEVMDIIFKGSRMPDLSKGKFSKSTAMCPKYEKNPMWTIGSFGSVWLDIKVSFGEFRVAFYPEKVMFVLTA